ncbi:MAG: cytochrome C biogenesis protein [Candidatus Staskawiczbacteria bacterium RIFOXYB2_FULL_32_9]|uniref:Cytochrome C biogenesis protein n=1 Tax=Candidatus Staskawiczbacteria bacterium RIFOXYD1_FULL_32_13 TaxID=1802234 RepID=A0A1G2JRQ2_9BACT|nr:MAG: cytochrome C biogenesis protein [Candidatus Staskawiczbacteria bacterium RIFOXYB1_FULL_32_11]OGZ80743.1 MAG: cytochrome C biogenesis protein [Candidatus Staskawiczbacteria bacterium RIFOXYA2_FULL_32_7]OGZ81344.1 MAG: cytochrome C biogenesis protein [Candidatus Staskawiczbacteria bacterium RIFOXYB2_FULL_32_9]OGZ86733.1 MAG: cytochrome C biogenesis protein [Candidatus Staskawiczbacteria bacterium RIFOXYC2_FULL_32_10]OGZ89772.1 MAG: cytochrome C biogenesis protein [Candidatus Staskawiczbac
MEFINTIINNFNIPVLSAFLLGILTSISPCPLATNITAIAYISKDVKTPKHTILSGLFYTLGRGISYTLLATLIYFGFSSFQISRIFQGWGDKVLGPILIIIGLVMLGVIKINLRNNNQVIEKAKLWIANKGYLGSFLLGMLFAVAFCPYSGVMFFGVLMPLIIKSNGGLLLSLIFAFGTGLPVIIFSVLIAFSIKAVGKAFNIVSKIEKWLRYGVASIFIITGIYYMQFLIKFIFAYF